jgi:hypothetical protein
LNAAWLELVREFRACPIGQHSPALSRVLSTLRAAGMDGKFCIICIRPHARWVIGRLSGVRGEAPVVQDNRVFTSIEDAEWEIFKLRCRAAGLPPIDEAAL